MSHRQSDSNANLDISTAAPLRDLLVLHKVCMLAGLASSFP